MERGEKGGFFDAKIRTHAVLPALLRSSENRAEQDEKHSQLSKGDTLRPPPPLPGAKAEWSRAARTMAWDAVRDRLK